MADKLLIRWAAALVALYPPSFRHAVGLDLRRLLVDRGREAASRSRWTAATYVAGNTVVSVGDAALEWALAAKLWTRERRSGDMMKMPSPNTLRHAARGLVRRPGYTIPALITLALGIGATSAMFSVLYGVVLEPLPYPEPERVVQVFPADLEEGERLEWFSAPDVRDWAERSSTMAALGAYTTLPSDLILTGDGDAVELETAYVTPGFFEAFAVMPEHGRFLTAEDDRTDNRVVVVSHGLWASRLGGDPEAVGRILTLNGEGYRLVGVMPASFDFPSVRVEAWTLLSVIPYSSAPLSERWMRLLNAVGRLAPGMDMAAAESELSSIAAALSRELPETNAGITGATVRSLHEGLVGDVRSALAVLMGAAGLVLLLVCANLANLALARESSRGPDLAVRAALGASRGHRVGIVVSESLLLTLLGAGLGLGVAVWGTALLVARSGGSLPRAHAIGPDWRVAVFALGASLLTGLIFAILPGVRADRASLTQRLGFAGRGSGPRRANAALVVSQVALAVVLLVGASLLLRSLWALGRTDPGFDAAGLIVAEINFPASRYDREGYLRRFDETLPALAAIPGVSGVGSIRRFPFRGEGEEVRWTLPGGTEEEGVFAGLLQVTPGTFGVMGIELLEGSEFAPDAGLDGRNVAVVSETLARQAFGGEPAVGRTLSIGEVDIEIAGVVEDVRQSALDSEGAGMVYVPQRWSPRRGAAFVLRTTEGDPGAVMRAVRDVVRSQDADQPITLLAPATEIVRGQTEQPRFFALLLGAFGALAMILSAVGVYGVVAAGVAQRRREVGIRMAIGADAGSVRTMVVRQGMTPVALGVALGLAGAFAGARLLESLLFGVSTFDPLAYGAAAGLLVLVGAAACYLPARSASGTDPVEALAP